MDAITKNLLEQISNLHEMPSGASSVRKNGKSVIKSSKNIVITRKEDNSGIDILIKSSCKGEACHIPVVITEHGLVDVVQNDFYIEDGADVTIVAGCGIHSDGESSHEGVHFFHVGEGAKITYVENHLAMGNGKNKNIHPVTRVVLGKNSTMVMNTTQIGGVDESIRKTFAKIKDGAYLEINEKILTDRFNIAKTDFKVELLGENSRCVVSSKSVARGESEQVFKSDLVGKTMCYGRVECDAILLDEANVVSVPKITAKNKNATLNHEATIGKIASEQLVKLMTLGLTEKQAEEKIITGFLK